MSYYEAPAKVNLSLHVRPPGGDGYHPLDSIVQTIDWCDRLGVEPGEGPDRLEVEGAAPPDEENLVLKAVAEARTELSVPALVMTLTKRIPVAAGLGGGSSDAAAALVAVSEVTGGVLTPSSVASRVGADVRLFLTGGTLRITGRGDEIEPLAPLSDFALAVAVPEFGLGTGDVYRRWDEMEGPEGDPVPDEELPPSLRGETPMRNDLLSPALDLEPRLGDFMSDVRSIWGTAVCLTGAGSGCFGYFATVDEARDAASAVSDLCSVTQGVLLRDHGVSPVAGPADP